MSLVEVTRYTEVTGDVEGDTEPNTEIVEEAGEADIEVEANPTTGEADPELLQTEPHGFGIDPLVFKEGGWADKNIAPLLKTGAFIAVGILAAYLILPRLLQVAIKG